MIYVALSQEDFEKALELAMPGDQLITRDEMDRINGNHEKFVAAHRHIHGNKQAHTYGGLGTSFAGPWMTYYF